MKTSSKILQCQATASAPPPILDLDKLDPFLNVRTLLTPSLLLRSFRSYSVGSLAISKAVILQISGQ